MLLKKKKNNNEVIPSARQDKFTNLFNDILRIHGAYIGHTRKYEHQDWFLVQNLRLE